MAHSDRWAIPVPDWGDRYLYRESDGCAFISALNDATGLWDRARTLPDEVARVIDAMHLVPMVYNDATGRWDRYVAPPQEGQ